MEGTRPVGGCWAVGFFCFVLDMAQGSLKRWSVGFRRRDNRAAVTKWGTGSVTRDWRVGWTSTWEWNAGGKSSCCPAQPRKGGRGRRNWRTSLGRTLELPLPSEPSATWKSVGYMPATVASCPQGDAEGGVPDPTSTPWTVLEESLS